MSWPLAPGAPLSPNSELCPEAFIPAVSLLLNAGGARPWLQGVAVTEGRCQWPGALESFGAARWGWAAVTSQESHLIKMM